MRHPVATIGSNLERLHLAFKTRLHVMGCASLLRQLAIMQFDGSFVDVGMRRQGKDTHTKRS